MKILCIVDNFPPEVNALASRTYEHAVEWIKSGHEVTVVTCCPNFPQGKPFPGYKNRLISQEILNGIKVIRVWSYMAPNTGFYKRILDFITFSIMAFLVALPIKCNIILTSSPQFFVNFSGLGLKLFKNKPWYMEVRDLWPESILALNFMKRGLLYSLLEWFEFLFYTFSDKIIVVTKSFELKISAKGISPSKIQVITNGINLELYFPQKRDQELYDSLNLNHKKNVIGYMGTLGEAQNLLTLIPMFKELEEYTFLIIGDGTQREAIIELVKKQQIKNIVILPQISKKETPQYYSLFDIGLIPLRNDDTFKEVIPSKIFELASMSIPILMTGSGETAEIIERFKIGISLTNPTVNDLRNAFFNLRMNESENLNLFKTTYSRKNLANFFFKKEII